MRHFRNQHDPYDPLRRELAALGYLAGEIRRAVAYHEEQGTFRGCPLLDTLDQVHAEILMDAGRPMAELERRR